MKLTRRQFLKSGTLAGAAMLGSGCPTMSSLTWKYATSTLDPNAVDKYAMPLVVPPAMPRAGTVRLRGGKNADYYEIAVKQFVQQVLPPNFPQTTVWSYGSAVHAGTFNYPAFTIEARVNTPVRIKWINGLVDSSGNYLHHLLPVDQTLHWANPPGGVEMRDRRTNNPEPYTGPVPIVTHVHGAHVAEESDGYAEAWYLPNATDIPDSDISPIWNPEFFGNTMVVNGRTWPFLTVEPRRYRFRLLNGCNSRFVILKMVTGDPTVRPGVPALPFWQIGAEGGFLPAPAMLDSLLIGPAERADVIVDFTGMPEGTEVFIINEGPDEPFGGGVAGSDFPYADPETTGQVMKLIVGPLLGPDPSLPPERLVLPNIVPLGDPVTTRDVTLNEEESEVIPGFGPRAALLGTLASGPLLWIDDVTENPMVGDTEVWNIHNFTMDAHPIHLHQVMFEVLGRTNMEGVARPPEPGETGFKDTVIAYPDEITTIKARFDIPGRFVWHCHIIDHEDNEMMRPYHVGPLA